MIELKHPIGISGERGLLAAVIARATVDATGAAGIAEMIDAWDYLSGPLYREHLHWLDVPPCLPEPITTMSDDEFLDLTEVFTGDINEPTKVKESPNGTRETSPAR